MKIRSGDKVKILRGKDKGKEGKVEKVLLAEKKIVVEGVNQYKKNQKPQGETKPGGIITITKPIRVENVALVCPKCNQPTKVGYKVENDNKKYRVCKKCKEIVTS